MAGLDRNLNEGLRAMKNELKMIKKILARVPDGAPGKTSGEDSVFEEEEEGVDEDGDTQITEKETSMTLREGAGLD